MKGSSLMCWMSCVSRCYSHLVSLTQSQAATIDFPSILFAHASYSSAPPVTRCFVHALSCLPSHTLSAPYKRLRTTRLSAHSTFSCATRTASFSAPSRPVRQSKQASVNSFPPCRANARRARKRRTPSPTRNEIVRACYGSTKRRN